ncbi:MAG: 3'-5' exonuclease [Myxococcota bacterium]
MARAEPPAGPPWDLPFDEAPLVFVDLELTGLDLDRDRVVQICIERVVGARDEGRLCRIVAPGVPLGRSTRFHGIRDADVEGMPFFSDLVPEVLPLLHGTCIVAHGAKWDVGFLKREFARAKRTWTCDHYLDTLALARRLVNAPRYSLSALATHFAIDHLQPHRADNDVATTRRLHRILLARFLETWPRSRGRPLLRDVWRAGVGARAVTPEVMRGLEVALAEQTPVWVRYRSTQRRTARDLVFQPTALRSDLDPPVVLGYLQPSRGRRELRVDRILELRRHPSTSADPDDELRRPAAGPEVDDSSPRR